MSKQDSFLKRFPTPHPVKYSGGVMHPFQVVMKMADIDPFRNRSAVEFSRNPLQFLLGNPWSTVTHFYNSIFCICLCSSFYETNRRGIFQGIIEQVDENLGQEEHVHVAKGLVFQFLFERGQRTTDQIPPVTRAFINFHLASFAPLFLCLGNFQQCIWRRTYIFLWRYTLPLCVLQHRISTFLP